MAEIERLLRTGEVAMRWRVSRARVAQLREAGILRGVRTALGYLYRLEDVERAERRRTSAKRRSRWQTQPRRDVPAPKRTSVPARG